MVSTRHTHTHRWMHDRAHKPNTLSVCTPAEHSLIKSNTCTSKRHMHICMPTCTHIDTHIDTVNRLAHPCNKHGCDDVNDILLSRTSLTGWSCAYLKLPKVIVTHYFISFPTNALPPIQCPCVSEVIALIYLCLHTK